MFKLLKSLFERWGRHQKHTALPLRRMGFGCSDTRPATWKSRRPFAGGSHRNPNIQAGRVRLRYHLSALRNRGEECVEITEEMKGFSDIDGGSGALPKHAGGLVCNCNATGLRDQ